MGACSLQNSILMQFCVTFASRLKTPIFVLPEGLCTCSNYKKFFIKSSTHRNKKRHPRWSASIWSENRAPDVLQKRGNTPGGPKTPHNSPQYALKTAPRRPQTAPRRP